VFSLCRNPIFDTRGVSISSLFDQSRHIEFSLGLFCAKVNGQKIKNHGGKRLFEMEGSKKLFSRFSRERPKRLYQYWKIRFQTPTRAETENSKLGDPLCVSSRGCRLPFHSRRKMSLDLGGAGSACPRFSAFLPPRLIGPMGSELFPGKSKKEKSAINCKGFEYFFRGLKFF